MTNENCQRQNQHLKGKQREIQKQNPGGREDASGESKAREAIKDFNKRREATVSCAYRLGSLDNLFSPHIWRPQQVHFPSAGRKLQELHLLGQGHGSGGRVLAQSPGFNPQHSINQIQDTH